MHAHISMEYFFAGLTVQIKEKHVDMSINSPFSFKLMIDGSAY